MLWWFIEDGPPNGIYDTKSQRKDGPKMSRLYTRTVSDSRKTDATTCGHQMVKTSHYHGSANNSKKAVQIVTSWTKGRHKPTVHVSLQPDVKTLVFDTKGEIVYTSHG